MKYEIKKNENGELQCPNCEVVMTKVPNKRLLYLCETHGYFRIRRQRKPRQKDMTDPNNWKATCSECGGIMDYYNFKYGCRKCGNILEV